MRSRTPTPVVYGALCAAAWVAAAVWMTAVGGLRRDAIVGVPAGLSACFGAVGMWLLLRFACDSQVRERALLNRVEAERSSGKRLCLAAIESLAYAVEAKSSSNIGHLARVQLYAVEIARAMQVGEEAVAGVRIAALLHDIGRLGVPENILSKQGALTDEEREKMRAYPVLGGRILAAIPFPWPVVSIVRHHQEHYAGGGYPDGLSGDSIPLGARILAVADAYDALVSGRSYRPGYTHEQAMAQIARVVGSQFDPAVVTAFRTVVERANHQIAAAASRQGPSSAAFEIACAQREVQAIYDLACSFASTLGLDETIDMLSQKIPAIVNSATCVIYLIEEDGEHLRAYSARGVNVSHFVDSRARMGTYLTGRAATRNEQSLATFLANDIELSPCADPWSPLRSTLIVPLTAEGRAIGTINLYHVQPDAFNRDDARLMAIVGDLAGRAVQNARLFAQTQETAYTDALTGLRNARYMHHFLDHELNRARKNHHPLAVLGLDLDGFKQVNDNFGHERGDQVLRELGEVFQRQVRNYDLVARYAGDEFAIILPETDRSEAELVAQKIKLALERYADGLIAAESDFPRIGVSVGIALFPDDGADIRSLLSQADQAMYSDKRASRESRQAA